MADRESTPIVSCADLSMQYGALTALSGVGFSIPAGEVVGLLGPNGAGKSTLLRILCGYLVPDSGSVSVCGLDTAEEPLRTRRSIGYMPERAPAYGELTPVEYLSFVAAACGVMKGARSGAINRAIERSGLSPVTHRLNRNLSKGFRQRLALAAAIVHDPSLVVLDEPGAGLDPNQIQDLRSLITELAQTRAVIVSSHIMQEIEAVASRVLILDEGRLVADGSPATLLGSDPARWIAVVSGIKRPALEQQLERYHGEAQIVEMLSSKSGSFRVRFVSSGQMSETSVFEWAVQCGVRLSELGPESDRLESVFRRLTHSQDRER